MSAHTNIGMNLSNRTVEGFIRFGRCTTGLIEFNDATTMLDIYGHIYQSFNDVIPSTFHVEFYSVEAKKVLHLDDEVLKSKNNPFLSDPNCQKNESVGDYVELLIVDDSLPDDQNNPRPNTLFDMISSGELDDDLLMNTILSGEFDDTSLVSPSVPNPLNDVVITHNNIATDDVDDDDDDDMVENSATENLQFNSQNSTTSSLNDYKLATQSTDENHTQSNRVLFSHDVQPGQKHHYLSNKYNIDNGSDENGGISYIQGIKTEEETKKKLQVLPHLLIPQSYRNMENVILKIYAVYEEEGNGMRIWYINSHKGFLLHNQLNPDAEFFNPIKLDLKNTQWKADGDYTMEMYMLTKLNKNKKNKEEVYRLDEQTTIQIHKAKHIVSSKRKHLKPTRLLTVIEYNNEPDWNTFGLSNFIEPPTKKLQLVALNGTSTVQITSPPPKRQKT